MKTRTKSSLLLSVILIAVIMFVALGVNAYASQSSAVSKDGLTAQMFTDKNSYKNGMQQLDFDCTQKTNDEWKALIWPHLCDARRFEIHCWKTEKEWIDLALKYGGLVETNWQFGRIIVGDVTPEFIEMVMKLPKPTDTELFNKMTPFFSIFLDDIFCSEHYGTELYQKVKNNK